MAGTSTAGGDRETSGMEVLFYCVPLSLSDNSGGVTKLGLTKFEAKIGQENEPSIRMFQKLHFKQVSPSRGEV